MPMDRLKLQLNITRLVAVMLLAILIIIARYGWLQLVQGSELSERMRFQVGQDYLVQSPRGAIIDCKGRELAASTMTKSLFVDPNNVENPEQLAKDLAPLIRKSEEEILEDIKIGGGFVWVKRRLEQSEYEAVRKLIRDKNYLSCLNFRDEAKRYYPNDVLAANVLGFVGTDDKGLDGIEQAFDKYIKGEVVESFLYTDTRERPILESIFERHGYNGDRCKTIQLTIDSAIQFIVEQELGRVGGRQTTALAVELLSNEIICAVTFPQSRFFDFTCSVTRNISENNLLGTLITR